MGPRSQGTSYGRFAGVLLVTVSVAPEARPIVLFDFLGGAEGSGGSKERLTLFQECLSTDLAL
jgi:hypothetical protein